MIIKSKTINLIGAIGGGLFLLSIAVITEKSNF